MLSDSLRFGLFTLTTRLAGAAVGLAVALSLTADDEDLGSALVAAAILSLPLLLAAARPWSVWRSLVLHPGLVLIIGPLTLAVGLVADRSAFYYPEVAWIAVAAIAGGLAWAVGCVFVLTFCSTLAGVLNGDGASLLLTEPVAVLGPRLLLALILAALVEALAQIVWLGAVELGQRRLAATTHGVYDAPDPAPAEDSEPLVLGPGVAAHSDAGLAIEAEAAHARSDECERRGRPKRKKLTDLERDVLECMADGLTVAQAARHIGITARAARARIQKARRRNDIATSPELVNWAVKNGYLAARRGADDEVTARAMPLAPADILPESARSRYAPQHEPR